MLGRRARIEAGHRPGDSGAGRGSWRWAGGIALACALLVVAACADERDQLSVSSPVVSQDELDAQLRDAAWANEVARARRLIAAGADVNATDATVQSPYLIATSEGYVELLRLTLDHGADVMALDGFNGTGLIRASERGHVEIVRILLDAGIDVNHVNNLGWTALHEAIILGDGSQRYVDTVDLLIRAGADLDLPARGDGLTPAEHAERRGQRAVVELLRAAR